MNNLQLTPGLLTPEHNSELAALSVELADTWAKRQVFRTETEMRVSVLNDYSHPTPAGKYWQAVREQANMLDNLAVTGFEYRRNENIAERKRRQLVGVRGWRKHLLKLVKWLSGVDMTDLDNEALQIDIDEAVYRRAAIQQNANDRMRELKLWSQIKTELNDGSFDTTDVNVSQLDELIGQLEARRASLTQGSSQAEVLNVLGPLQTAKRVKGEQKCQKKIRQPGTVQRGASSRR